MAYYSIVIIDFYILDNFLFSLSWKYEKVTS